MRTLLLIWVLAIAFEASAQRFVKRFRTVAEMVAASTADVHDHAFVDGYYTPGDGGGGMFALTNTITSTNLGSRIVSTATPTVSWERMDTPPFTARQFGAKHATDSYNSAPNITSLLALANNKTGKVIIDGSFNISTTLTVPADTQIIGGSMGISGELTTDTQFLNMVSPGNNVTLDGLTFRIRGVTDSYCVGALSACNQLVIRNCSFRAQAAWRGSFIYSLGSSFNGVLVTGSYFEGGSGLGISASGNNITFTGCEFYGFDTGFNIWADSATYFTFTGNNIRNAALWCITGSAITVTGNTFRESPVWAVLVNGCTLTSVVGNTIKNPYRAGAAPTAFGVYLNGCFNTSVLANTISIADATSYGIAEANAADNNVIQANMLDGVAGTKILTTAANSLWLNNYGADSSPKRVFSGSAALDFPSITASGGVQDLTITVTGAATGDTVLLGIPTGLNAGLSCLGWVSAGNTVTIRLVNSTAGAIDPASATWKATVARY